MQATALPQGQGTSEAAKQAGVAPMLDASTAQEQEEQPEEGAEDALDSVLDGDDDEDVDLGSDEVGMDVASVL